MAQVGSEAPCLSILPRRSKEKRNILVTLVTLARSRVLPLHFPNYTIIILQLLQLASLVQLGAMGQHPFGIRGEIKIG